MHTPRRKYPLYSNHTPINLHAITEWEREVRKWKRALIKYSTHTSNCRERGGHDCDCGLEELRAEAAK